MKRLLVLFDSKNGKIIKYNASSNMSNLFSDIIGDLAFGVNFGLVNGENHELRIIIDNIFECSNNLLNFPLPYYKYFPFNTGIFNTPFDKYEKEYMKYVHYLEPILVNAIKKYENEKKLLLFGSGR